MFAWLLLFVDRIARWPFVAGWCALIFALSSIPNQLEGPPSAIPYDTIAHAVEFGVLGFLLAWVIWRSGGRRAGRAVALAVALSVAYGVTDELHQAFVPGRDVSLTDLVTDVVASFIGALAAMGVAAAFERETSPASAEEDGVSAGGSASRHRAR